MRVTSIDLYSEEVELFTLDVRDPQSDNKYLVRSIVGLDAEEIVPKFYAAGAVSGKKMYNASLKPREIGMKIVLNPLYSINESVSELRDVLYRAISRTRTGLITLNFKSSGSMLATISGHVTKIEVDHFAQQPEVGLTINCEDPMFRGLNPIRYSPTQLGSLQTITLSDNESTAPHGLTMQLTFTGASAAFTVQEKATNPDWTFRIAPSGGFLTGDILTFSNEDGKKSLYITRGASTIHLLDVVNVGAVWPIVFPGMNTIYIPQRSTFNWVKLEYYPVYWGV